MNNSTTHLSSLSKDELIAIIQSDTQQAQSFKNLLTNINGISWEYNLKTDSFTFVCPATQKILGYTPQEWVNYESWKSMIHPSDRERAASYCATKTQDGEDHFMEYKMLKKNGETIWVLDIVTLSKDKNGSPTELIGFIIDITQNKTAQLQVEKEHRFLQTVLDSIPDPIMIINEDYSVPMMNKARKSTIQGRAFMDNNSPKCYEISHFRNTPCDGEEHACPLKNVLETKKTTKVVHNHKHHDGSDEFFELTAVPLFDADHNCTGILETAVNITPHIKLRNELQSSNEKLMHLAHHDYLTGLPNRALFMDRLSQTIKDATRNHMQFALFFMDLDHFKEINDNYGHDIGDSVLKEFSKRCLSCLRDNDTLARLGGDEFTLIMKGFNTKADIETLARKIITISNKPLVIDGKTLHISTSIGISLFTEDANNADELLVLADDAMYMAKKHGKNNFYFSQREN